MKKLDISDPRIQQAIVLYNNGKAIRPICKELQMDGEALRKVLIKEGLLRTRSKAGQIGKGISLVNDDAFDELTPEVIYWIGFLYADGHIEKERPRISLTLTPVDLTHMEKFAAFIGCKVRTLGDGNHRVAFSSLKIHQRLQELGFTNRKTWDIDPHILLKNSRDFWRGVVDGDGWIFYTKQQCVGVCGHKNTLLEFMSFINRMGVISKTNPYKDKRREFIWRIDLHHHKAKGTANLLYKDATIYLDRKYKIYLEYFAEPVKQAA